MAGIDLSLFGLCPLKGGKSRRQKAWILQTIQKNPPQKACCDHLMRAGKSSVIPVDQSNIKSHVFLIKNESKKCAKICMFIQVFTQGKCTFAILSAKPGELGFL
jgi:hypothetical protein